MSIDVNSVINNTASSRRFNPEPYANTPLSYFQFKNKIDGENKCQQTTDEYIEQYLAYLNHYKKDVTQ